jgi:hypothetical protein
MITQERLKELFEYEEATGRLRRLKTIGAKKSGSYATSKTKQGYLQAQIDGRTYTVHRLVYLYHFGEFPIMIDHINRDKVDNRLTNLRVATFSQNACNTKKRKDNTSGTKGVTYCNTRKAWLVKVTKDSKVVVSKTFKGSFDNETIKQEAIAWVSLARQQYHGEFTNHG